MDAALQRLIDENEIRNLHLRYCRGIDRMDAVSFGRERAFMEVDTPEEYDLMIKEMYPRLRRT